MLFKIEYFMSGNTSGDSSAVYVVAPTIEAAIKTFKESSHGKDVSLIEFIRSFTETVIVDDTEDPRQKKIQAFRNRQAQILPTKD